MMYNFIEIKNAYNYLISNGVKKIIIMKCDTSYPSKLYDANLKRVKTVPYRNNYGYFFTSGPNTWHGMEKKEIKKERRCVQVNYVNFRTDWKVRP